MIKVSHFSQFLVLLVLTFGALICGACSSSQPTEKRPDQSSSDTQLTTSIPPKNTVKSSEAVTCDQLFPADQIKLLLNSDNAALEKSANAGLTTCTWQYPSKNGSQQNSFEIQAGAGDAAVQAWKADYQAKLAAKSADAVVTSIDQLGDENYTWVSQPSGTRVVYIRKGNKTVVLHFSQDVLYLQSESGIIDMADRVFNRF